MGRKGRPSLSCHPEERSDEGPLSASRDFVGNVPMKGSLASLGMTNGTNRAALTFLSSRGAKRRGTPFSVSRLRRQRADEGIPRFARDDKWDEKGGPHRTAPSNHRCPLMGPAPLLTPPRRSPRPT